MPVEQRAAGERRRAGGNQWKEQLMAKKNRLMASPHDGFHRYKCSKPKGLFSYQFRVNLPQALSSGGELQLSEP